MTDVMTTKKPKKQKAPELIAAELLDQLIVQSRPVINTFDEQFWPSMLPLFECLDRRQTINGALRKSAHFLRFREQAGNWLMTAPMVAVLDPVAVARHQ